MSDTGQPEDNSVTEWIRRSADGDVDARGRLYSYYYDEMVRLAAQRLSRLPTRWDPEDFVQSGGKSLFRWMDRSSVRQPANRNEFRNLIGRFVERKVSRRIEQEMTQKRGQGQTVTETDLGTDFGQMNLPADQFRLTSAEFVEAADSVEQLLSTLSAADREIVELVLQGFTNVDIAKMLHLSEAAIRQKRKRIAVKCEWFLKELETRGDS